VIVKRPFRSVLADLFTPPGIDVTVTVAFGIGMLSRVVTRPDHIHLRRRGSGRHHSREGEKEAGGATTHHEAPPHGVC
jgi:hypothetical protein